MHTSAVRVVRVVGLVVLLVAASALGPLAWGPLRDALGQSAGASKPVVVPITPFRLFDTRPAPDDPAGGPDEPFGQGETRTYQVAGVGGIPADAVGVVVNMTAVGSTADAFVTLFPGGASRPNASTLNPSPGRIVFNSATVLLGAGKFSVFLNAGSSHLLADVVGYLVDHNHDERYLEQTQPIVVTYGPGGFTRYLNSSLPTVLWPAGHLLAVGADNGGISLSLDAPTSVGGTQYRLSSVEYCLHTVANGGFVSAASVLHDQPGATSSPLAIAVTDPTDRTAPGCFTLQVPALTPRGYSIVLGLAGQNQNLANAAMFVQAVKGTWVPVTGAASAVADGPDPVDLGLPAPSLEQLLGG